MPEILSSYSLTHFEALPENVDLLTSKVTPPDHVKGTNPALKKSSNIPEIYAKMFGRFH